MVEGAVEPGKLPWRGRAFGCERIGHSFVCPCADSRLMAIVSGEVKEMKSAEDHLLPAREIGLLKAWISAGRLCEIFHKVI